MVDPSNAASLAAMNEVLHGVPDNVPCLVVTNAHTALFSPAVQQELQALESDLNVSVAVTVVCYERARAVGCSLVMTLSGHGAAVSTGLW